MSIDYTGKVVIVTGSSSGIGQAAAVLFAKSGASVTIHGRSEDGLKKTENLILEAGVPKEKIHCVKGAVNDPEVQKALIDKTVKTFGKIDVLINNAGGTLSDPNQRSMESLNYCLDINLKAPIALTELAIPHLEKTKGNIVNVSSVGSQKTNPVRPFYCIAKAALDHFARNYAAILAPKGIRVNNLNPGATETEFFTKAGVPPEMMEKYMKKVYIEIIPLRRWGTSEEMAEFLLFMASEKASYMTGQLINVDGGVVIHSPAIKFD